MKISVSDLLFPGFQKYPLRNLDPRYGVEFFYEFGKDYYWNEEIPAWGPRQLSMHGPCAAVNLANPGERRFLQIFLKAFTYARKVQTDFVVLHTNEDCGPVTEELKDMIRTRLHQLATMAECYDVRVAIENVGLRTKNNLIFTQPEFIELIGEFPNACALLDTGHAHVNGWNPAELVRLLGSRLAACHVHDNDGSGDSHLPVGSGTINWDEYFAAVKEYAPHAVQVLEYSRGFADAQSLQQHIDELSAAYKFSVD